jgi:hypothetical protein
MMQQFSNYRVWMGGILLIVLILIGSKVFFPNIWPDLSIDVPAPTGPQTSPESSGKDGILKGRITLAGGAPISGVFVTPKSTSDPPEPVPDKAVLTNEQGEYWWSLWPGSYTITFSKEGYQTKTLSISIQKGEKITLDATLDPR